AAFDVMDWVRRHCPPPHGRPAPMWPAQARAADARPPGTGDDKPPCPDVQCYYVVACYQEEEADFTTPFIPGCQPAVAQCEATRIREGVRIDLVDKRPPDGGWISALEERLLKCLWPFVDPV